MKNYEIYIVDKYIMGKEELKTLLKYFGEDMLEELIISGRIDLRIREDILGSMIFFMRPGHEV